MARTARVAPGGDSFSYSESWCGRIQLFEKAADYQRSSWCCGNQSMNRHADLRYALMPNHWHLLVWPERDGELAAFMQRLTVTYVRRWQQNRGYAGLGHVYQGRYKSFPVESDEHVWVVARYVGAMRCVRIWSCERKSGGGRVGGDGVREHSRNGRYYAPWPLELPPDSVERVNQPTTAQHWKPCSARTTAAPIRTTAVADGNRKMLGLESAYRPAGRPRKFGTNRTETRE